MKIQQLDEKVVLFLYNEKRAIKNKDLFEKGW